MKSHVTSGVAVVEELIRDFDLGGSAQVSMLRNIVRAHHEALDGSGYPDGLKAGEIPLEARIVAVADVFDALTSDRPYKETWSPEEAFGFLVERKGTRFDAACVAASRAMPPRSHRSASASRKRPPADAEVRNQARPTLLECDQEFILRSAPDGAVRYRLEAKFPGRDPVRS